MPSRIAPQIGANGPSNRCVSKEELDLFQLAASGVAQVGARPPQIVRS